MELGVGATEGFAPTRFGIPHEQHAHSTEVNPHDEAIAIRARIQRTVRVQDGHRRTLTERHWRVGDTAVKR
jgi:hypothetical protein